MSEAIDIRASSIASIIDCPLRGLSIQLGLVKQLPSTAPACIGSACHDGTAVFDQAIIDGSPISIDEASEKVVAYIENPPEEVNWGNITLTQAINRALGVHLHYCAEISTCIEYEYVELPLGSVVIDAGGSLMRLTGTLDRVYRKNGGRGILDIKTGVRVMSQKPGKHKGQLGVYEVLAEQTLGEKINLPGLIGRLQTSDDYEVDVAEVSDAKVALLGTDYQLGLIDHIGYMLKTGDWYGNPSSWLCSEKYCPLYFNCIFK